MPLLRKALRVSNRSMLAFIFFFSFFSSCLYFIYVAPGIGECGAAPRGAGRGRRGAGLPPPGCPRGRRGGAGGRAGAARCLTRSRPHGKSRGGRRGRRERARIPHLCSAALTRSRRFICRREVGGCCPCFSGWQSEALKRLGVASCYRGMTRHRTAKLLGSLKRSHLSNC